MQLPLYSNGIYFIIDDQMINASYDLLVKSPDLENGINGKTSYLKNIGGVYFQNFRQNL